MATARERSGSYKSSTGSFSSVYEDDPGWGSSHERTRLNGTIQVIDVLGNPGRDNPFFLDRIRITGGIVNGRTVRRYWGGPERYNHIQEWIDYPSFLSYPVGGDMTLLPETESAESAALRARNMTNPGRPDILLPNFLAELKDLPKMWRQAGDTARYLQNRIRRPGKPTIASSLSDAKRLAADNIATQFGWRPLLQDLWNLSNFGDSLNRRKGELNRLHSGNGLKRRVVLEKRESITELPPQTALDAPWWDVPGGKVTQTYRRWATVRYAPTAMSPLPTMDAEILRMLSGLTVGALASNLWETIPWSWLVDYFTNIGDLCQNSNNSAQVICTSCVVMTHNKVSYTVPGITARFPTGDLELSPFERLVESKARNLGIDLSLLPTVGLPFLSGQQLSILGSFAVLKAGR